MRYRLTRRLVFYVVTVSSFFTLLATSFQLYLGFRDDVRTIDENLLLIRDSYADSIAASVYKVDEEQIAIQLKGALQLTDIVYLEVVESHDGGLRISKGDPFVSRSIERRYPLVFIRDDGREFACGTLTAMASLDGPYERLWNKALTIFLTNAAKTFVATIILLVLVARIITRHLQHIVQQTSELNVENLDTEISLDRTARGNPDELDHIVQSINGMRLRILEYLGELSRKNAHIQDQGGRLRQARAELEEKDDSFRNTLENLPVAILLVEVRKNYPILFANQAFSNIFGYKLEELNDSANLIRQIFPDPVEYKLIVEDLVGRLKSAKNQEVLDFRVKKVACRGGEVKDVEVSVKVLNRILVVVLNDVTERLKLQATLIQNEKMITVGGLAAGMAHEINNPLGIIVQGLQVAERRLQMGIGKNRQVADRLGLDMGKMNAYLEDRSVTRFMKDALEAGYRASDIVGNMLKFSRRSSNEKHWSAIDDLVEHALDIASKDYDLKKGYDFKRIEILRSFDSDLPAVLCTPTEIEQVVLNIVKNAAQAMAEVDREDYSPKIDVAIRRGEESVIIDISDNGPGMSEEIAGRIFEPFFTTKAVGSGTGLGMSVSYFIITKNHRGSLTLETAPGQGAKFVMELPVNAKDSSDDKSKPNE